MADPKECARSSYPPKPRRFTRFFGVIIVSAAALATGARAALTEPLKSITAVAAEGKGNEAASSAWKEVVQAGPSALPEILAAMGRGTAVADNWLRLAGDVIVQNAFGSGKPLPVAEMEAFLRDTSHAGSGRRLAFDLIRQQTAARRRLSSPLLFRILCRNFAAAPSSV
jgi:hypothetical protein